MIIFTRKENTATMFFWEYENIIVEPPFDTQYQDSRFWRITLTGSGVTTEFDSAPDAKQYIRKYLKSGTIIFKGLSNALELMDKRAAERREEEDMEVRQSTEPNGRYEEVGRFPSKSSPDTYYTVKLDSSTGDYTCDCPAWIYKADGLRSCKHTRMLVDKKGASKIEATLKEIKTTSKRSERLSAEERLQRKPKVRPTVRKLLLD